MTHNQELNFIVAKLCEKLLWHRKSFITGNANQLLASYAPHFNTKQSTHVLLRAECAWLGFAPLRSSAFSNSKNNLSWATKNSRLIERHKVELSNENLDVGCEGCMNCISIPQSKKKKRSSDRKRFQNRTSERENMQKRSTARNRNGS